MRDAVKDKYEKNEKADVDMIQKKGKINPAAIGHIIAKELNSKRSIIF